MQLRAEMDTVMLELASLKDSKQKNDDDENNSSDNDDEFEEN